MSVENILEALDKEIANLTQARMALAGLDGLSGNGAAVKGPNKRMFSAASRRKMAAAQKARWAKHRANGQAKTSKPTRVMSPASRRKIAAAQKARWAKYRAGKKAA